MSFDADLLFWLLLPVAAASGWFLAKYDRHRRAQARDLPTAYFKGLNFLLNEQPDKAIEVFVQALEVNSETVETHLALGSLFRRRGEVDRAIRIHQNLIARPMLDKVQRAHALLELGQDYLKAGLFDRAENLFLELVDARPYNEPALRFLMNIYQQEREWDKAIDACRQFARIAGKNQNDVIAQYCCELAQDALAARDYVGAREQAKRALGVDTGCVRASILLGDAEAGEGRHAEAIAAWRRIEEQDPHYLSEVAHKLGASFRATGDDEGMYRFFDAALQRHGGAALLLVMADIVSQREGGAAAEEFVIKWLRRQPSVAGLQRLIELHLAHASESARQDLTLLRTIIEQIAAQQQGYTCQQCGFRGRALHWQCPSCHRWNTVKPTAEKMVA